MPGLPDSKPLQFPGELSERQKFWPELEQKLHRAAELSWACADNEANGSIVAKHQVGQSRSDTSTWLGTPAQTRARTRDVDRRYLA